MLTPSSDDKFSSHTSATFRELILLPRKTTPESALTEICLKSRLADGLELSIPFMSSAMESVTGEQLAIALALQGGIGVLPAGRVEVEEQLRQIESVKNYRDGFLQDCQTVEAEDLLERVDALEAQFGFSSFPVIDGEGKLLGAISSADYDPRRDLGKRVVDKMLPLERLTLFSSGHDRAQIVDSMMTQGLSRAYLVDTSSVLKGLVMRRGLKNERRYVQASRDEQGRLRVAAAISTHSEDRERAKACLSAGVDLLSIDASDGFSTYMRDTVEFCKTLGLSVVAGNVVDKAGFDFLAESGADAVKVGIGSGSICTTRRVKAIGRGQATALREVVLARDAWAQKTGSYLPVVSDGGIEGTGDMSVALALGADVLMMGKYFAGFAESPTTAYSKKLTVLSPGGGSEVSVTVKPYWGEASARAKNVRRYQQNDPRTFVIEGEEGYILCKGSLHDLLPRDLKAISGTLSSCGCKNLSQFRRDVTLERQTPGSQQEGGISILQG